MELHRAENGMPTLCLGGVRPLGEFLRWGFGALGATDNLGGLSEVRTMRLVIGASQSLVVSSRLGVWGNFAAT